MEITVEGRQLSVSFEYNEADVSLCRSAPGGRRFDSNRKRWLLNRNLHNYEHLLAYRPDLKLPDEVIEEIGTLRAEAAERDAVASGAAADRVAGEVLSPGLFRHQPYQHQKVAYLLGRDKECFAYLMDQGTGKTKVIIDDFAHNFRQGRVELLIVVAPNSVKTNWVDPDGGECEITKHWPPDLECNMACWDRSKVKYRSKLEEILKPDGRPTVLSINVEAFAHPSGVSYIGDLIKAYQGRVMMAIDESTRIKKAGAKRTKALTKLGKLCTIRRIASGTPLIKSPLDAFAQFRFLNPDILGYTSFSAFRNHYAIMGGFGGYQVLQYQNLEELSHKVRGVSYRVLKRDCLDLPEKQYVKREVGLTQDMREHYNEMRENMITEYEDGVVEAPIILTQILRMQQITAGLLPILDADGQQIGTHWICDIPPKMQEVLELASELDHKFLVWARFKPEIEKMCDLLNKNGFEAAKFYGGTPEAERMELRRRFNDESDPLQCLVLNTQTGGIGLTLNAAKSAFYITNSYATEDRVQSEDRCHRIGQTSSVLYSDIFCPGTVDVKVLYVLRNNINLSAEVMKDGIQNWI